MTGPAIKVEGLVKRFGARTAVDGVSMRIESGEIAGFLGPNGSGKTTMIRVMCGLLTPDAGHGKVLGYDLHRDAPRIRREVGYMTQRFSLYGDLTLAENLSFVAGLYGLTPLRRHVNDTMEEFGLTARRDQLAGTLSGGWKQRLSLAACIMHRPRLLLLDEPTAGVDPQARREFWQKIHEMAAGGITVLVSTHYMDEAERCHSINYISFGRLVASGTVQQVIDRAGLVTYLVEGEGVDAAETRLRGRPGVDQIAAFGPALHVVGTDAPALQATLRQVTAETGTRFSPAETSLEDAFIRLIGQAGEPAP